MPESPGDLEAEAGITETLKDWCANSSPVEFVIQNCGGSVHALRRYLPHGTPTDLYWQYLAWHEGRAEAGQPLKVFGPRSSGVEATEQSRPASWSTFWRVYTKWFEILRPRAKSDHGQCQTCFELQTDMYAKHFTPQQKLEKAHAWRVHLQHQYLDRQIYWSLRHASKIKGSNILTIIIDSMDKKKTVWPKWAFDRPSKEIEKLGARPRVVITAALAHGYTTSWFLAPDELTHGADAYCEVLCQVAQEVSQVLGPRPLPQHLVLQVDNTVSQAKNGHVGAFCAYMVAKQLFHTVTLNFLMVGHTHEDVDQVFSLLVSQVIRRYRYETVQDLKQYMEAVLGPSFCKDNQQFHVKEMTCIRKFTEWLKPLGVTQHGCWATRKGIEAPHSFTYKFLMDLTGEEQAAATHHSWFRSRYETSAKDVMCCVKTYMRDTHLQQAPLCVLPGSHVNLIDGLSPPTCVGPTMTQAEKEHFNQVAATLDDPYYGYHRAAAGLRSLVRSCEEPAVFADHTPWLHNVADERGPLLYPTQNPFFTHLPESSWTMKVQTRR